MKFILTALLLLVFAPPALACQPDRTPASEYFNEAASVFHAKITESKLVTLANPENPEEKGEYVEIKYQVIEKFKGNPPDSLIGPIFSMCEYGFLVPGMQYVFLEKYDANTKVHVVAGGTGMLGGFEKDEIQKGLENVRALAKSQKKLND